MNVKSLFFVIILTGFTFLGGSFWGGNWEMTYARQPDMNRTDPLNTAYNVENEPVVLVHGRSEKSTFDESATKTITTVFGEPVYGDLDNDGDDDAALILVTDPGGSGTFYYVAAAISLEGVYRGSNAVFLGDRVAPKNIRIQNGVIFLSYAFRKPEDPMSASPSHDQSMVLTFENGRLSAIKRSGENEKVFEGWVTIGHEVRSFLPCSQKTGLWITSNSPAFREIVAAYREALPGAMPYTPLFVTLAGKFKKSPTNGFGAEYERAFFATRLVKIFPMGNCRSSLIIVNAPRPGEHIDSPLSVSGRARGFWFFEGDFPIVLEGPYGKTIASGFASAKSEWMTKKFVFFQGTLKFDPQESNAKGNLILRKDNPTGLPEHDDEIKIPVFFK